MTKLSKSHTANELFEVLIASDHVMAERDRQYVYNSLFHEGGNERVNPSNSVVKMALCMQIRTALTRYRWKEKRKNFHSASNWCA